MLGLIVFSKHDSVLTTITLLLTRRLSLTILPTKLIGGRPLVILVLLIALHACVARHSAHVTQKFLLGLAQHHLASR